MTDIDTYLSQIQRLEDSLLPPDRYLEIQKQQSEGLRTLFGQPASGSVQGASSALESTIKQQLANAYTGQELLEYSPGQYKTHAAREMFRKTYDQRFSELTKDLQDGDVPGYIEAFWEGNTSTMEDSVLQFVEHGLSTKDFKSDEERQAYVDAMQRASAAYKGIIGSGGTGKQAALTFGETLNEITGTGAAFAGAGALATAWTGPGALVGAKIGFLVGSAVGMGRLAFRLYDATEREYESELVNENIKRATEGREMMKYNRNEVVKRASTAVATEGLVEAGSALAFGFGGNAAIRMLRRGAGDVADDAVKAATKAAIRDTQSVTGRVLRTAGEEIKKKVGHGMVTEGFEEGAANILNSLAANAISEIDMDRLDFGEAGHDALIGAIVGGGLAVGNNVAYAPIQAGLRRKARKELGTRIRTGMAAARDTMEMEENLEGDVQAFAEKDDAAQQEEIAGFQSERAKLEAERESTRRQRIEKAAEFGEARKAGEETDGLLEEYQLLEEKEATLTSEINRIDTGLAARRGVLGVPVAGGEAASQTVEETLDRVGKRSGGTLTEAESLTEDEQAAVDMGRDMGVEVVVFEGSQPSFYSNRTTKDGKGVLFLNRDAVTSKADGQSEVLHEMVHYIQHTNPELYSEIRAELDELSILSAGMDYVAVGEDARPTDKRAATAAVAVANGLTLGNSLEEVEAVARLEAEGVARALEKGKRANKSRIDNLLVRLGLGTKEETAARNVLGLLKQANEDGRMVAPTDKVTGLGAAAVRLSEQATSKDIAEEKAEKASQTALQPFYDRIDAAGAAETPAADESSAEAAEVPEGDLPDIDEDIDVDISENRLRATAEGNRIAVTETPEFKNWFGNSKVVDEQGRPIIMYHGTRFEMADLPGGTSMSFDPLLGDGGMHLTSHPRVAAKFATRSISEQILKRELHGEVLNHYQIENYLAPEGGRVYPLYLRIEKPLTIRDTGSWNSQESFEVIADFAGVPRVRAYRIGAEGLNAGSQIALAELQAEIDHARKIGDTHTENLKTRDLHHLQMHMANGGYTAADMAHGFPVHPGLKAMNFGLAHLLRSLGYDGVRYLNRYEMPLGVADTKRFGHQQGSTVAEFQSRSEAKFNKRSPYNNTRYGKALTDEEMQELLDENGVEEDICYYCIDANQVKSATANKGGYRLDSDDISENRSVSKKKKAQSKKAKDQADRAAPGHIMPGVEKALSAVTLLDLERVVPEADKTGGEPMKLRNGHPHRMADGRSFNQMEPSTTITLPPLTEEDMQQAHEAAVFAIGGESEFEALKARNAMKVKLEPSVPNLQVGNKRDGIDPSTQGVLGTEEYNRLREANPPDPEAEPTAISADLVHNEDGTPAIIDPEFVNESLALPAAQRFWYETFGEDVATFLPDIFGAHNDSLLLANLISATSAQTAVEQNMRRGLSIYASTKSGQPSFVGMPIPTSVQQAQLLEEYGLDGQYKTGSFAPTLMLGLGVFNEQRGVPLTVLDVIMSRFFRLPQSVFSDPIMYRYGHTVMAKIAQIVNQKRAMTPEYVEAQGRIRNGTATDADVMLVEAVRPWQVQAVLWSNRADDSGTFSDAMKLIREDLIAVGIEPDDQGGFSTEQLTSPEALRAIEAASAVRSGTVTSLQVGQVAGQASLQKDNLVALAYALLNSDVLTDAQKQTLRNKLSKVTQQDINLLKEIVGGRNRLTPAKNARVGLELGSYEAFVDAALVQDAVTEAMSRVAAEGGVVADVKIGKGMGETLSVRIPVAAFGLGYNATAALPAAEQAGLDKSGLYRTASMGLMSNNKVLGEGTYAIGSAGVRDGFITPEEHILAPGLTAAESVFGLKLLGIALGQRVVRAHRVVEAGREGSTPALAVFVPGQFVRQEDMAAVAGAIEPHGMQLIVRAVTNGSLVTAIHADGSAEAITDDATDAFADAMAARYTGDLIVEDIALDYVEEETGLRGDGTDSPAKIRAAEDKFIRQIAREDASPNSDWSTKLSKDAKNDFAQAGITTQADFAKILVPDLKDKQTREAFERAAQLPLKSRKRIATALGRSRAYQLHVQRNQIRQLVADYVVKTADPVAKLEQHLVKAATAGEGVLSAGQAEFATSLIQNETSQSEDISENRPVFYHGSDATFDQTEEGNLYLSKDPAVAAQVGSNVRRFNITGPVESFLPEDRDARAFAVLRSVYNQTVGTDTFPTLDAFIVALDNGTVFQTLADGGTQETVVNALIDQSGSTGVLIPDAVGGAITETLVVSNPAALAEVTEDISENREAPKTRTQLQNRGRANLNKLDRHRAGPMFAMILGDVEKTQKALLGNRLGTSPGLAATDTALGVIEIMEQLSAADADAVAEQHLIELRDATRAAGKRAADAAKSRAEMRIAAEKRKSDEQAVRLRQQRVDALLKAAEDKKRVVGNLKDRLANVKEQLADEKVKNRAALQAQREEFETALNELDADRLARTERLLRNMRERSERDLEALQSKYEARAQVEQIRREAVERFRNILIAQVIKRLPKSERGAFLKALSKPNITLDRFEKIAARIHEASATYEVRAAKDKLARQAKRLKKRKMSQATRTAIQEKLEEAKRLLDVQAAKAKAAQEGLSEQEQRVQNAMELRRVVKLAKNEMGEAEAAYQADREAYMDTKNERGALIRQRVEAIIEAVSKMKDAKSVGDVVGDSRETSFLGYLGKRGTLDLKAVLDELGLTNEHSILAASESGMLSARREILLVLDEAAKDAGFESLTELVAHTSGSKGLTERNFTSFTYRDESGKSKTIQITLGQALKLLAFDDHTLEEIASQATNRKGVIEKPMKLDFSLAEREGKIQISGKNLVEDIIRFRAQAADNMLVDKRLAKFVQRAKKLREQNVRPAGMAALYRLTGTMPEQIPGYEPRKVRREMGDPETALDGNSSQQTLRMAQGASFTKERTGGATIRVTDFMMDYFESVDAGLRLAFMGEPTRVIWAAITDSEVQTELENKLGTDGYRNVKTHIGYALGLVDPTGGDSLQGDITSVGASALISFNIKTFFKVLFGGINNLQLDETSTVDISKGTARAMKLLMSGRFSEFYESEILARNGYFWDRDHSSPIDRRVTFTRDDGIANVKDVVKFNEVMYRGVAKFYEGLQALAVGDRTLAKRKAREGLRAIRGMGRAIPVLRLLDQFIVASAVLSKAEPDAITDEALHEAELMVRNTQNTSSALDDAQYAAVARVNGGLPALLTTFSSDPLKTASRMREAQPGTQRAKRIAVAMGGNAGISILANHLHLMLMLALLDDDDEADELLAAYEKAKVADGYDKVVIEEVIGRTGPLGFIFGRPVSFLYNQVENAMTVEGAKVSPRTANQFVEAMLPIGIAPVAQIPAQVIDVAFNSGKDPNRMYENFEQLMVQLLQVVLGLPIGPMKPYLDAGFTETNTAEIRSAEYGLRNTLGKEVLKEHEKVLKKGRAATRQ